MWLWLLSCWKLLLFGLFVVLGSLKRYDCVSSLVSSWGDIIIEVIWLCVLFVMKVMVVVLIVIGV